MADAPKTTPQIIKHLRTLADDDRRAHSERLGIRNMELLGVSMGEVRKLAKTIGKNDTLADELWQSGVHEARLIAVLCADQKSHDEARLNSWLADTHTWDLCDLICNELAKHMGATKTDRLIKQWHRAKHVYMRRAALSTIASISVHHKTISNDSWQLYINTIIALSSDDELHIKKAASWALRGLGKRSELDHQMIMDVVYEMKADSASPSAVWIAKDALKELEHLIAVPERERLISSKTTTGRKAIEARQKG